jgi:hypothetical protein
VTDSGIRSKVGFRAGEWVEVKSAEEILATLDKQGSVDGLPFMPEMLRYCGMRFRVSKSAHKTCDTIGHTKIRQMSDAAHLEGLRCDGSSHGGCQAGCLLFWKSAWLKRGDDKDLDQAQGEIICQPGQGINGPQTVRDLERLTRITRASDIAGEPVDERYYCQATELFRATTQLRWWDPRPYFKDIVSRNVSLRDFVHYALIAALNILLRIPHHLLRFLVSNPLAMQVRRIVGNRALKDRDNQTSVSPANGCDRMAASESRKSLPNVNGLRHDVLHSINTGLATTLKYFEAVPYTYPNVRGLAGSTTPRELLALQPGELVQVRSKREIRQSINNQGKNRGLSFTREMAPYCGKTFRVLCRVERIINEKTGAALRLPHDCIVLQDVICDGCLSQSRLFCPRGIYPFWREIWLRRVEQVEEKQKSVSEHASSSSWVDSSQAEKKQNQVYDSRS